MHLPIPEIKTQGCMMLDLEEFLTLRDLFNEELSKAQRLTLYKLSSYNSIGIDSIVTLIPKG